MEQTDRIRTAGYSHHYPALTGHQVILPDKPHDRVKYPLKMRDMMKNGVLSVAFNIPNLPYQTGAWFYLGNPPPVPTPPYPCAYPAALSPPDLNRGDDGTVRWKICTDFNLSDTFRIDPWLNGYVWGAPTSGLVGTDPYPSGRVDIEAGNPRYHKFFSMGPDGTTSTLPRGLGGTSNPSEDNDDIIP